MLSIGGGDDQPEEGEGRGSKENHEGVSERRSTACRRAEKKGENPGRGKRGRIKRHWGLCRRRAEGGRDFGGTPGEDKGWRREAKRGKETGRGERYFLHFNLGKKGCSVVAASGDLMGRRAPGTGLWGVDKGEARDDGTQPCSSKLATAGADAWVEVTFVSFVKSMWFRKWALCGLHRVTVSTLHPCSCAILLFGSCGSVLLPISPLPRLSAIPRFSCGRFSFYGLI